MREAGVEDPQGEGVMRKFWEIFAQNEGRLRQETTQLST